jgi:hypothetical protein
VHLYYKELMDMAGFLLPPDEIHARLQKAGISPEAEIVATAQPGFAPLGSRWF